jgi:MFS family permease
MPFIYLINFFLAVSSSMAMSLAPLFMTQTLGLSRVVIGLLEGCYELSADVMKLVSGRWIDRTHKKKRWITLGIMFSCLSKPFLLLGMAPSFVALCFSRLLERVSNGSVASARDILIAVQSPDNARGKAYGKIMMSKTLGCFIGPFLLAFWCVLYPSPDGSSHYISLILVSLLFSLLAGWFMGYLPQDRGEDHSKAISAPDWQEIWKLVTSHKAFLGCFSLFMLGRFNDGVLILYLKDIGFPPEFYLSTIGIFNYVSLMTAHPVGRLLDRGYQAALVYATVLALVLFNACFLIKGEIWVLMVGVGFWGFQRSSFQIIFTTLLSHIVPASHLGTALGLAALLKGVIFMVSCTLAGILAGFSYKWVFIFGLTTSLLTLLAIPRKVLRNVWQPST